jgi:DNA primase
MKPVISAPLDARVVKAGADFVSLVSRYTWLRRAGRQLVGLCPFHSERHPSFYVEP